MVAERIEYYQYESEFGPLLIETRTERRGTGPVSSGVVIKTGEAVDALLSQIGGMVGSIQESLLARLKDASEIGVEFGIKVAGKAGIVIAATELEGNFKVSVKWHPKPAP